MSTTLSTSISLMHAAFVTSGSCQTWFIITKNASPVARQGSCGQAAADRQLFEDTFNASTVTTNITADLHFLRRVRVVVTLNVFRPTSGHLQDEKPQLHNQLSTGIRSECASHTTPHTHKVQWSDNEYRGSYENLNMSCENSIFV